MKILVLNCGSSSIKYKLFEDAKIIAKGLIERIGEKGSKIRTHKQGIRLMLKKLPIKQIKAVGHRVVHGGNLSKSIIINKKVINIIKKYSRFAPLHNPYNLQGILETKKVMKVPHIAVFDTSFHRTIPEYAYTYALPPKYKVRRYGFHGISHQDVAQQAAKILKKPKPNLITCHLGAGCSITAIKKGKVIDTSMGFTPSEGLVMATRTGDIDPGIINYFKLSDDIINKKSGLLGLTGYKDIRPIIKRYKTNKKCRLALEIFCYRIKKYIGAYSAVLGKVDAVIFTGGIGENVFLIRKLSTTGLKIKTLVIPTDEEKLIAKEIKKLIK